MGYYCAWGDTRMGSSEEEGYEYRASDDRGKRRNHVSDTFDEIPSNAVLSISDDTDRQFWAEDELSNSSDSQRRLTPRRKRRHSVSYRNRTTNKNRSCAPTSSNSSSDSVYAETSPKACKMRKYCRRQKPKIKNLRSVNMKKESSTSIEERVCTLNEMCSPEWQTASTSDKKSADLHFKNHRMNSYRNYRKRAKGTTRKKIVGKKVGLQRTHKPSDNK